MKNDKVYFTLNKKNIIIFVKKIIIKMATNRIFITVKDLCILTGKTYLSCWREIQTLKDCLGKKKEQKITIEEYSKYEGISINEIRKALNMA